MEVYSKAKASMAGDAEMRYKMELAVDRLTKQFKNKIAVDRVSYHFHEGVYGLLGANGAV